MDGIVWGAMTRSEESCTLGKPLRAGTYLRERGNENGADRPVETLAPASVRGCTQKVYWPVENFVPSQGVRREGALAG